MRWDLNSFREAFSFTCKEIIFLPHTMVDLWRRERKCVFKMTWSSVPTEASSSLSTIQTILSLLKHDMINPNNFSDSSQPITFSVLYPEIKTGFLCLVWAQHSAMWQRGLRIASSRVNSGLCLPPWSWSLWLVVCCFANARLSWAQSWATNRKIIINPLEL